MKFKRFGALLVSAVLCIGMAAPAFAFEGWDNRRLSVAVGKNATMQRTLRRNLHSAILKEECRMKNAKPDTLQCYNLHSFVIFQYHLMPDLLVFMPDTCFLASFTVRWEMPSSAARRKIRSQGTAFPSARTERINSSACAVLLSDLPPKPPSNSSLVMSP